MDCRTCKFAPRYRNEHPCNRCVNFSMHSDLGFVEEQRYQTINRLNRKYRKRITVRQCLAVGLILATVVYVFIHVTKQAWGF